MLAKKVQAGGLGGLKDVACRDTCTLYEPDAKGAG